MTTQATGPSLRETLREVDAAIAEIIRAEVADPAERERLLAKLAAFSQSWPPITTHNAPRTDLPATEREPS